MTTVKKKTATKRKAVKKAVKKKTITKKKVVKKTAKKATLNGTPRKTFDVWCIYGNYGYGWYLESVETTRPEALANLKAYKENGGGTYKMVKKRTTSEKIKTLSGTAKAKHTKHKSTVKKVSLAKTAVKEATALISSLERTVKSGKAKKTSVLATVKKLKLRVAKAKKSLGMTK